MITIIYSTHKDTLWNKTFKAHLSTSVGLSEVQILEYVNNNEYSLSEIYNKGINESNYNIVVCLHNDVKLENGWGKQLMRDFENNPDYGIIGKAGSCYFPKSGIYWEKMNETMVGQVYHQPEGHKKHLSKYSAKLPFLIPVVTIDGLFMAFDKTKIKHMFDETIGKFHFYDHPFCLSNYLDGVKIGVTSSFEITHQSVGQPNEEFFTTKDVFLEKFGEQLPIDLKPIEIYVPEISSKSFKNTGKVAVVILTKDKNPLLFNCIQSFIDKCDHNTFELFIADTGSHEEVIKEAEVYISILGNSYPLLKIHLIKYDYYNFAKINNDVVRNHVDESFEYILFSNNDIKLLNNVIYGMMRVFKSMPKVGTVGCRLHYHNNLIQHDGISIYLDKENKYHLTHNGIRSYYKYNPSVKIVAGNTGALLMIRKDIFEKCGYFNENYINCFEDVELNLKCYTIGLTNYNDGNLVAYHYESQTRNEDPENISKLKIDHDNTLVPFIKENYSKLSNRIIAVG